MYTLNLETALAGSAGQNLKFIDEKCEHKNDSNRDICFFPFD